MSNPLREFWDFVDSRQVNGIDGHGSEVAYVPFQALQEHWDYERINAIFSCLGNDPARISNTDIIHRFLRIFSILAFISSSDAFTIGYITAFVNKNIDDYSLPLKLNNDVFPTSPEGKRANKKFCKSQFRFSHVQFGPHLIYNRNLDADDILPVTFDKVLSGNDGEKSVLKKYILHKSSNLNTQGGTIVVKEYAPSELNFSFANEVEAYIALENYQHLERASDFFLKYYGSFTQNGKGFLLLEYADQGSLADFFATNLTPHDWTELHNFWNALTNLILGLSFLHRLDNQVGTDLRGTHQDLKPSNIFVFRDGDGLSYQYRFKIGDFDLSNVKLVEARARETRDPDNKSTKMYGAPELTNVYRALEQIDCGVTWEADIWSLGCVLFETAVWTVCGERGRDEFLHMRQMETHSISTLDLDRSGYSGAFHDGEKRLKAVDDILTTIRKRRRVFDNLTQPVASLILENMMLSPYSDRLKAIQLLRRFNRVLNNSKQPQLDECAESSGNGSGDRELQRQTRTQGYGIEPSDTIISVSEQQHSREHSVEDLDAVPLTSSPSSYAAVSGRLAESEAVPNNVACQNRIAPQDHRASTPAAARRDRVLAVQQPYRYHFCSNQGLCMIGESSKRAACHPVQPQCSPTVNGQHKLTPSPRDPVGPDCFPEKVSSPPKQDEPAAKPSLKIDDPNARQKDPMPSPYPETTVPEVIDWIDKVKSAKAMMRPPPALQGRDRAIGVLANREQIFVVDDSDSMRNLHWADVLQTFKALAYLVKGCDPNGIELYTTSRPGKPKKARKGTTDVLVGFLESLDKGSSAGDGNIEQSLGEIFTRVKSSLSPGRLSMRNQPCISVYILTDGLWGGRETGSGVDVPIRSLVEEMKRNNLMRTHVSVQFIRFGDDPQARRLLRSLDNDLGRELNFDIVDQRSHRGNVWHMLIASINRQTDRIDEDGSEDEGEERIGLSLNGERNGEEKELG